MKNINVYIICAILLSTTIAAFAEPPGGGYNGWRHFAALFDVDDENGDPVEGVDVKVLIQIFGTEGDNSTILYGTTNSQGWVNLSTTLDYFGYELGHSMIASIDDDRYTVTSSSNTSTTTSYNLYPGFDVVIDLDQNGIHDDWELPLAEKFCPTLILHHPTEWLAPEPVEYIGVDKQDLWFLLYNANGQVVDDYPLYEGQWFIPPLGSVFPWTVSSNPNYSGLSGDGYFYTGQPYGKANGTYILRFHYNYAGNMNSPSQWISYYQNERSQMEYSNTVYAHLFLYDNKPVIQYWFFYPYNDGYNNHEGDWEHINVRISESDTSEAEIETIDYYFHHKVKTLSSGYQITSETHPIVYVGGSCAGIDIGSCESGNTTGGSYPWSDTWYNVGPFGYDEFVNGLGPTINFNNIDVIVIPNPNTIDYDENPEMCWLDVPIRWGNIDTNSPWDFIEPFIYPLSLWIETDVGDNAVPGPHSNEGWEKIGATDMFENY